MTRGLRALIALMVVSSAGACASRATPPPPAPTPASDAVRVARIVRLMELNRNRVALEIEQAGLSQRFGANHPQMQAIANQLATIDAAIKREFLPEEQAAVAAYEDRAVELRLRLEQELAKGRGESHPEVTSLKRQIATLEEMATAGRAAQEEATLLARVQQTPDDAAAQIELALHYVRAGRAAEAERALDRALKLLRRRR